MKLMDLNSGNTPRYTRSTLSTMIGLICLGSASSVVYAQEQQEANNVRASETIVVLGEKLGGTLAQNTSSVTIFTAEADNGEDRTYYDLLDRVPNVSPIMQN
ncbi:hypothetical protein [Vibrio metschnikovii]|uniref:hypothetical protein n=1 Tax=Vibrio metschnikovii TaxID=28172 RepID=UPI002FC96615